MIGRPLGISDGDWDTPAPEPVDVQTKNLLLHVGVAKVFGDICILANSADPDDRETLYGNAHARLLKFRSSLPEEYQLTKKPITVFGNFLHIAFHTATILLHRVVHGRYVFAFGTNRLVPFISDAERSDSTQLVQTPPTTF